MELNEDEQGDNIVIPSQRKLLHKRFMKLEREYQLMKTTILSSHECHTESAYAPATDSGSAMDVIIDEPISMNRYQTNSSVLYLQYPDVQPKK